MFLGFKSGVILLTFLATVTARSAPKGDIYDVKEVKERTSFFNSDEHDTIGKSVRIPPALKISSVLTLPNGIEVPFSKIVALAGDFFGVPDSPIIDPKADGRSKAEQEMRRIRFSAAFGTLAFSKWNGLAARVEKLDKMIDEDHKATKTGGKLHSDRQWDEATGGVWVGELPVKFGEMLKLATKNFDHFQPQAKQAYLTGHELAVNKAREAANDANPITKKEKLMEAYALDAFAAHFLTDSFSSGHIRTPRVELHNKVTINKVGDYLSKFMHDEDCKYGLRVKNNLGRTWVAYGDKYLLADVNEKNLAIVKEAIWKSFEQVYKTFMNPKRVMDPSLVTDYMPFVDPDAVNNAPLFQMKDGELLRRKDVANLQDKETKQGWWAATTLTLLEGAKKKNPALKPAEIKG